MTPVFSKSFNILKDSNIFLFYIILMLKNTIISKTGFSTSTYLINNKLLTNDSLKNVINLFFQ